jgi:hypothetical protein
VNQEFTITQIPKMIANALNASGPQITRTIRLENDSTTMKWIKQNWTRTMNTDQEVIGYRDSNRRQTSPSGNHNVDKRQHDWRTNLALHDPVNKQMVNADLFCLTAAETKLTMKPVDQKLGTTLSATSDTFVTQRVGFTK